MQAMGHRIKETGSSNVLVSKMYWLGKRRNFNNLMVGWSGFTLALIGFFCTLGKEASLCAWFCFSTLLGRG